MLPPASLSVQGSVGSHIEENRPTLHEILPLLRAERFTERFTSRYFNKFLKMNKTRTFMHSLKEQIECIKNMLLPRKTDYYFKSYNVSNITSLVTNNVRNVNGPRYKKL